MVPTETLCVWHSFVCMYAHICSKSCLASLGLISASVKEMIGVWVYSRSPSNACFCLLLFSSTFSTPCPPLSSCSRVPSVPCAEPKDGRAGGLSSCKDEKAEARGWQAGGQGSGGGGAGLPQAVSCHRKLETLDPCPGSISLTHRAVGLGSEKLPCSR